MGSGDLSIALSLLNIAKKTWNIAKKLSEIQTFRTKNIRSGSSLKMEKQRDIILNNFLYLIFLSQPWKNQYVESSYL